MFSSCANKGTGLTMLQTPSSALSFLPQLQLEENQIQEVDKAMPILDLPRDQSPVLCEQEEPQTLQRWNPQQDGAPRAVGERKGKISVVFNSPSLPDLRN